MITVNHLTSAYGRKQILRDISFTAGRGECVGIVGANGCGKSTLLSILAGVQKPQSGEVMYYEYPAWSSSGKKYGSRVTCNREVIRKMTGYVPQENPLIPELSVYDNLRIWYPNRKQLDKELAEGALHLLGIDEFVHKKAEKLSGGMKKRVSIGIAMAGMPPILLLDEPGAALDLVCKAEIHRYLEAYLARKGTVVITTHEAEELALCNKLYVMKNGILHPADPALRGEALVKLF